MLRTDSIVTRVVEPLRGSWLTVFGKVWSKNIHILNNNGNEST